MKTTKEQVLKAAETSPEAKQALQELFPDAFEPEWESFEGFKVSYDPYMSVSGSGSLARKGLYLSRNWDWLLTIDNCGDQILQARKKKK